MRLPLIFIVLCLLMFIAPDPALCGGSKRPKQAKEVKKTTKKVSNPYQLEAYKKMKKLFSGRSDMIHRDVKRLGDNTIGLEAYINTEIDRKYVANILTDYPKYQDWLLKDINMRPGGGEYYVKFKKVSATAGKPASLKMHYALELPIYKYNGIRTFKIHEGLEKDVFTIYGETIPSKKSIIWYADSKVYFFKAADNSQRTWVYLKGHVKLGNAVVYQALPDRLLKNEVSARLQKFVENYLMQETKVRRQKTRALTKIAPPKPNTKNPKVSPTNSKRTP